jgi:hypothetical protein
VELYLRWNFKGLAGGATLSNNETVTADDAYLSALADRDQAPDPRRRPIGLTSVSRIGVRGDCRPEVSDRLLADRRDKLRPLEQSCSLLRAPPGTNVGILENLDEWPPFPVLAKHVSFKVLLALRRCE